MKKKYAILTVIVFAWLRVSAQTTNVTVNSNDVLTSNNKLVIENAGVGQSFFTGHQVGSTYAYPTGIFRAITDNPTYPNYFYDGVKNGITTFSVRSDGQGYYAGNLGIGTLNPGSMLHVAGTITSSSSNGIPLNLPVITMQYNTSLDRGELLSINNGVVWKPLVLAASSLSVLSYGDAQGLYQNNVGNVGIGTTSPDAKLAVKGTIHTQEVKVDMSGWNDFVFDKTYLLPTLLSVKTYIDQYHHLPEIPSETEVIKNGVNLGEMVKLQTKKIEELTLYLIEKDKQVAEQQKQLGEQQKINQYLQAQINQLAKKLNK